MNAEKKRNQLRSTILMCKIEQEQAKKRLQSDPSYQELQQQYSATRKRQIQQLKEYFRQDELFVWLEQLQAQEEELADELTNPAGKESAFVQIES